MLEVSVGNDHARTLYENCGFQEVTVYDYFEQKLFDKKTTEKL